MAQMPTSRFRELTFIEISTFVLVVMMNCSDTHPDRKIMKVSFPKGSLIQTFKMTWPQLAQGRSHKIVKISKYIFKEMKEPLLSHSGQ